MKQEHQQRRVAFTLLELLLVAGLMVLLAGLAVPRMAQILQQEELPGSARQFRSLLRLVRSYASIDGKRYRIRFPEEDEAPEVMRALSGANQPIVEREFDPIHRPEEFEVVTSSWVIGNTFLGDVWCAEVRLGRPTIDGLLDQRKSRSEIADALAAELEDFAPERPPLIIEADGTSDWATFVLTSAPNGTDVENLAEYPRIELISEGMTGLAWMQRPFYEEELSLFAENGWPAVLRQDFVDPRILTENDVLELRERQVQRPQTGQGGADEGPAEATPSEATNEP